MLAPVVAAPSRAVPVPVGVGLCPGRVPEALPAGPRFGCCAWPRPAARSSGQRPVALRCQRLAERAAAPAAYSGVPALELAGFAELPLGDFAEPKGELEGFPRVVQVALIE